MKANEPRCMDGSGTLTYLTVKDILGELMFGKMKLKHDLY